MDTLDAVYFAVETMATIGYGDFSLDAQPAYLRVAAIVVMIATVVLLAAFYALVTEYLVSRRIAATFGLDRVTGMVDHVIVVGLGSLGIAVVERLVQLKQQVVVVERDQNNRHIGRARALGVPVLAQDATQPETLTSANLPAALGVAVLTSDEYANIETGLAVRDGLGDRDPEVPVVMRVFDRRLGGMLEERLHFHHVRSVSAVSAPWFVAAALGLDVIATFAVDQEAFIAGRLTVRAEGGLAGVSMLDLPMRGAGHRALPRGRRSGTPAAQPDDVAGRRRCLRGGAAGGSPAAAHAQPRGGRRALISRRGARAGGRCRPVTSRQDAGFRPMPPPGRCRTRGRVPPAPPGCSSGPRSVRRR